MSLILVLWYGVCKIETWDTLSIHLSSVIIQMHAYCYQSITFLLWQIFVVLQFALVFDWTTFFCQLCIWEEEMTLFCFDAKTYFNYPLIFECNLSYPEAKPYLLLTFFTEKKAKTPYQLIVTVFYKTQRRKICSSKHVFTFGCEN